MWLSPNLAEDGRHPEQFYQEQIPRAHSKGTTSAHLGLAWDAASGDAGAALSQSGVMLEYQPEIQDGLETKFQHVTLGKLCNLYEP